MMFFLENCYLLYKIPVVFYNFVRRLKYQKNLQMRQYTQMMDRA